jgi:hypothetical protein
VLTGHWYIACRPHQLARKPLARTIHGKLLVTDLGRMSCQYLMVSTLIAACLI